jgi:hypothetical protein
MHIRRLRSLRLYSRAVNALGCMSNAVRAALRTADGVAADANALYLLPSLLWTQKVLAASLTWRTLHAVPLAHRGGAALTFGHPTSSASEQDPRRRCYQSVPYYVNVPAGCIVSVASCVPVPWYWS